MSPAPHGLRAARRTAAAIGAVALGIYVGFYFLVGSAG